MHEFKFACEKITNYQIQINHVKLIDWRLYACAEEKMHGIHMLLNFYVIFWNMKKKNFIVIVEGTNLCL